MRAGQAKETDLDFDLSRMLEITFSPIVFRDEFKEGAPHESTDDYESIRPYTKNYPMVYVLYSDKKPNKSQAYVGETASLKNRMKVHLRDRRRNCFDRMIAIGCEAFHKSATYGIETKLIECLLADGKYVLQNSRQTSPHFVSHNYFEKNFYEKTLFSDIWNQLLDQRIAQKPLVEIENSDVFKLSPFKQLSPSQDDLVQNAVKFCREHIGDASRSVFVVKGEAGTGKSVVLSCLFKQLNDIAREEDVGFRASNMYFLVNHEEQLKTYHEIARGIEGLTLKMFQKPTSFANVSQKSDETFYSDITIVDEAHLLLTRSDPYKAFRGDNHLDEIIKHSRITVIVYDEKQVLKFKSYWNEARLREIVGNVPNREEYRLDEQFRMLASAETIHWIDTFVEKGKLRPLPEEMQENAGFEEGSFEFLIFDDAKIMHEVIKKKNSEVRLSRMVATFDYEHKKDGAIYYVEEGLFKLPWNIPRKNETWAECPETIDEVGSIYTVQGFDLNYAGVILGPSLTYDPDTDSIKIISENYKDREAFKGKEGFPDSEIEMIKEKIIMNSVNVLMKRAVRGLYIYASDEALRSKLMEMQQIARSASDSDI